MYPISLYALFNAFNALSKLFFWSSVTLSLNNVSSSYIWVSKAMLIAAALLLN